MKYQSGYDHRLFEPEYFELGFPLDAPILTPDIAVSIFGRMRLRAGYSWNGANVIPDWRWILRGSAGHDGGYQLLRLRLLPADPWRERFDRVLQACCYEDAVTLGWPAWIARGYADTVYQGVHLFGASAAEAASENPVLTAP